MIRGPVFIIPAAARQQLANGDPAPLWVLGATAYPGDHEYGLEGFTFMGWTFQSITNFPAAWYQAGEVPRAHHFLRVPSERACHGVKL